MRLATFFVTVLFVFSAKATLIKKQISGQYIVLAPTGVTENKLIKSAISLGQNYYLIKLKNKNLKIQSIKDLLSLEMITPNFEYVGDPREVAPTDPHFSKQNHHKIINSVLAWDFTLGDKDIVIAVTDNGVQLDHPDLKQSWWINQDETPGNGIDDDNNGYIDDVNGWDFNRKVPDPSAKTDREGYAPNSHGTHVSGIIAASINNLGIVGVAPNVKVMPLKFFEYKKPWTSAIVLETYLYAINNGANIISTSYNIDGLSTDRAYIEAIRHAKNKDVLIVNSAGNGNAKNPPRQKRTYPILVCSTKSGKKTSDHSVKSKFSNYGTGIDICAPGDPIFSTLNGQYEGRSRYGNMSGTSMAAPVVAGVLALVWSQNPSWTGRQVRRHVLNNVDKIDQQNRSRHRGMLGSGRVNAYKATSTTSYY